MKTLLQYLLTSSDAQAGSFSCFKYLQLFILANSCRQLLSGQHSRSNIMSGIRLHDHSVWEAVNNYDRKDYSLRLTQAPQLTRGRDFWFGNGDFNFSNLPIVRGFHSLFNLLVSVSVLLRTFVDLLGLLGLCLQLCGRWEQRCQWASARWNLVLAINNPFISLSHTFGFAPHRLVRVRTCCCCFWPLGQPSSRIHVNKKAAYLQLKDQDIKDNWHKTEHKRPDRKEYKKKKKGGGCSRLHARECVDDFLTGVHKVQS